MSYTNVFGGNTIYPSDVSYLALALSVDTPLEWPLESSGLEDPAARIIDVTPSASGRSVILPDATLTGAGQTILFNNVSGSFNFYVKDFAGNTLATVGYGEQWQVYLAATSTPAGTWRVFRYGASTATVQPSALAGFGLTVTGSTLSQSLPVAPFSTTGLTVATSNRASAFVWTGAGAGTLNLLTAASAGNNFFVLVRNEGGGDLTIDPSGTETINNGPTLALRPGDSCTVITDGIEWYTVGLGQEPVFAFDFTSISVTGGNYTLAGSELNRIAYKFVGTLTSDLYVIIPATVQQYWITNATAGAFNFFVKIAGGTPIQVNSGAKGIYYCDGTNVILASDPTSFSLPVIISQGGTGSTTASGARLNLGITTFADPIVTATTGAAVRTIISAAASGANGDITSLTGLTTALSVAQGGTGQTSYTDGQLLIGNTTGNTLAKATLTAGSGISITNGSGAVTIAATGAGTVTSVDGSGGTTGLSLTGGPITSSGTLTLGGTLAVTNGGTGGTTAGTARAGISAAASGANGDITSLTALTTAVASTSLTSPLVIGGTTASSALTLRSTSGVGTSDYVAFQTGSQVERMRIDTAGNVGIGTTPGVKLDVNGMLRNNSDLYTGPITGSSNGIVYLNHSNDFNLLIFQNYTAGVQTAYGSLTSQYTAGTMAYNFGNHVFRNPSGSSEWLRINTTGNVGIGTSSPDASAILDVRSTTKGVRMPNMTTTEKNAISSPGAGLLVFDTTLSKLCVYSGAAWQTITST